MLQSRPRDRRDAGLRHMDRLRQAIRRDAHRAQNFRGKNLAGGGYGTWRIRETPSSQRDTKTWIQGLEVVHDLNFGKAPGGSATGKRGYDIPSGG